ncbi:hypothetical protein C5Y96_20155 [Blastopirellula marina]|uniref:BD-FAE-like domain-containing protein n=1 Tax=Blastopirellula marina TaxID=124 RepID=A0A2S8F2I7_9BACT|nr:MULTISPECIES: alpha/beta hydrolase [Pirellulaceae]PQO26353.1 hypothetical protein C5Y96_20155 [Blastopirellula marina]RCS44809.1 alpha/beta hydrolase [Bremerella cremea]
MPYQVRLLHRATSALLTFGLFYLLLLSSAFSQEQSPPQGQKRLSRWDRQPQLTDAAVRSEQRVFKSTPQGDLKLHIWLPEKHSKDSPCIVFFFGGGWKSGSPQQFARQSEYLASRGMVAVSAEYRVSGTHKTTPDVCVEDAKSAIRWVREHADQLGIDPERVIAGGGSAGGHLAAATALVHGFNAKSDNLSISAIPDALVLFNPALDLTLVDREIVDGEGHSINEAISATRFLHKKAPPTIIFFGTDDPLSKHGVEYVAKAKDLGLDVDLWWAAGKGHGFFNDSPWLEVTTQSVDQYLTQLGYLSGEPTVSLPENAPKLKRNTQ